MEPNATTCILFMLVFFSIGTFPSLITASPSNFTAVFAFGDSLLDAGNNNNADTVVVCNFPPYGQDFPDHVPTGRFSNGKLAGDFLVSSLGLKDILPAYIDPKLADKDLLTGVSFASGSAGLDPTTSLAWNMADELDFFEEAVARIKRLAGEEKSRFIVENAVFFFAVGTVDMALNFYLLPERPLQFSVSGYQDFLLQELESDLQRLYDAGARRFLVTGLPPIGCLPLQQTIGSIIPGTHTHSRVCVEEQNTDSRAYNKKLQHLISTKWPAEVLKGAKVVYFDAYNPIMDMISSPTKYGFEEALKGCCGTGTLEAGFLCSAAELVCPDTTKYLFWDSTHPTEAAYSIIMNEALKTLLPLLY